MRFSNPVRRTAGAVSRLALLLTAFALLPGAAAPSARGHLERLRLLPPVLLKGEKGYPLAEGMRRLKVEAVSVAVIKDFRIVWTRRATSEWWTTSPPSRPPARRSSSLDADSTSLGADIN